MATIKFNNGYTITAELNGNCFITDNKPNFPTDLSNITVTADDKSYIVEHGEIIEAASVDDRYWFAIRDIPNEELTREKADAQITYTAIMTDTLLEDE